MIRKHRIFVGATAAVLAASAVVVPVAITQTQQASRTDATPPEALAPAKGSTDAPAPVARYSYAAETLNPAPGYATDQVDLTPPAPLVLTDNATLTVGATALPVPLLSLPPPGYQAWDRTVAYSLEGTNEPVTAAALADLPARAVVLATATAVPSDGHTGPQYVATVRFEIQPLPVTKPAAASLLATRYAAYTTIDEGTLPKADLQAIAPPSQEANGYLPWDTTKVVRKYIDQSGRQYPLSTTYDWARMLDAFKNALATSTVASGPVFTIAYVWTTAPDQNHYDPQGDGTITYETRMQVTNVLNVTSASVAGNLPVQHAAYYLEGRDALITTMNQFATMPYQVERSATGVAVGAIKPYDFPASSPVAMGDGNAYPYTTAGQGPNRELLAYWLRRLNQPAAKVTDPTPGVSFVTMSMVMNNYVLPGTDFNVFGAVPSDTAVAPRPLVSISYDAVDAAAAVRMILQLKISYNFVNWLYFVTPQPQGGVPAPDLASIQQMFGYNKLLEWTNRGYGLSDSYVSWKSTAANRTDAINSWEIVDYAPFIYNSNFMSGGDRTDKTTFDFSKFNPEQLAKGQFFNVASLPFVPRWDTYTDVDKNRVRTSLFQPDSTTLNVGAYVEYKNGRLLVYLIPYIPGLPKVSFAESTAGAGTQNRDLAFAYEFSKVTVNVNRFNDSSLGWWT